ncbi:hypothetical protein DFP72DRAFT_855380 [Ephemerocybe angulata]|uniref:Uncharacterized protein n=1 Tax=Ephemerocybe angulata TaxID=980116 RepID=A0A8H6LXK8_9AGAR|nr:hypothetical protein DFP72DRAFT_855380 [Tulosesus angulatus]
MSNGAYHHHASPAPSAQQPCCVTQVRCTPSATNRLKVFRIIAVSAGFLCKLSLKSPSPDNCSGADSPLRQYGRHRKPRRNTQSSFGLSFDDHPAQSSPCTPASSPPHHDALSWVPALQLPQRPHCIRRRCLKPNIARTLLEAALHPASVAFDHRPRQFSTVPLPSNHVHCVQLAWKFNFPITTFQDSRIDRRAIPGREGEEGERDDDKAGPDDMMVEGCAIAVQRDRDMLRRKIVQEEEGEWVNGKKGMRGREWNDGPGRMEKKVEDVEEWGWRAPERFLLLHFTQPMSHFAGSQFDMGTAGHCCSPIPLILAQSRSVYCTLLPQSGPIQAGHFPLGGAAILVPFTAELDRYILSNHSSISHAGYSLKYASYQKAANRSDTHELSPGTVLASMPCNILRLFLSVATARFVLGEHGLHLPQRAKKELLQDTLAKHQCTSCEDYITELTLVPGKNMAAAIASKTYRDKKNSDMMQSKPSLRFPQPDEDLTPFPPPPLSRELEGDIIRQACKKFQPDAFEESGCAQIESYHD